MVAQSPEPGAHGKNALVFTMTIILTKFAKIFQELKYYSFILNIIHFFFFNILLFYKKNVSVSVLTICKKNPVRMTDAKW